MIMCHDRGARSRAARRKEIRYYVSSHIKESFHKLEPLIEGRKRPVKLRKQLIMIVIVALALPLLGTRAATAQTPITLEFWDIQQAQSGLSTNQAAAVKEFEAANPDIKIHVTTVPYPEYRDKLLIAVQGGTPPDVSTVDQIWNSE